MNVKIYYHIMAYEVIKTIGGRPYRYRVESARDPETGRVRNKWTYVGKADGAAPVKRRTTGDETKARLKDAFSRLVEREAWADVTAGAVAREAGLAPGTFYRHFKDRLELLDLCTDEANAALDARLTELLAIAETRDAERERVRVWAVELLRRPTASPGLIRLWSEVRAGDGVRVHRRNARIDAFAAFIETLRARGFAAAVGDVRPLAIALSLALEQLARRTSYERRPLEDDDYAAASATFDRLVFWLPPETDDVGRDALQVQRPPSASS
jgi:AcrR family transcriptional regulator